MTNITEKIFCHEFHKFVRIKFVVIREFCTTRLLDLKSFLCEIFVSIAPSRVKFIDRGGRGEIAKVRKPTVVIFKSSFPKTLEFVAKNLLGVMVIENYIFRQLLNHAGPGATEQK